MPPPWPGSSTARPSGKIDLVLLYTELSPNSRRAFESDRRDYETWCEANGRRALPMTATTVCTYLRGLEQRGLGLATVTRRLAGLRRLALEAGGSSEAMRAPYDPTVAATMDDIVGRWTARVG